MQASALRRSGLDRKAFVCQFRPRHVSRNVHFERVRLRALTAGSGIEKGALCFIGRMMIVEFCFEIVLFRFCLFRLWLSVCYILVFFSFFAILLLLICVMCSSIVSGIDCFFRVCSLCLTSELCFTDLHLCFPHVFIFLFV
jgi:hypothetical protein